MDEETHPVRISATRTQIIRTLNEAASRDPVECAVGYYSGQFRWFATSTDLLDALTLLEPGFAFDPDSDRRTYVSCMRSMGFLRRSARPADQLTENLRARFSEKLGGFCELAWWGSFHELCSGGSEWASDLRETWRNSAGLQAYCDASDPITDEEVATFAAYLPSYRQD